VLLALADHPREAVRYRLVLLLSRHTPVPQPGTVPLVLSPSGTDTLIRRALADESPRIRARAAALAYGTGRVEAVREPLLEGTRDPDDEVRSYCLIALGVLHDAQSLQVLKDAFSRGTTGEATAAIWALARRPDGVAIAVSAVDDPREHLGAEAVGALMHVSADLSRDQMAWLDAPDRRPEVRDALRAYRARRGTG
jgi:HEAT repeats